MFEITKIRIRRLSKLAVYGLAAYGVICLFKGCSAEGAEIVPEAKMYQTYQTLEQKEGDSALEGMLEKSTIAREESNWLYNL